MSLKGERVSTGHHKVWSSFSSFDEGKKFGSIMDLEKIFHMTEGVSKTSYSRNSSLQKKGADKVKHIKLEAIEQVYLTTTPKSLGIADLGCSSGPNTLYNIKDIVESIEEICRKTLQPLPEFRVCLNDLPSNDFNVIFRALPDFLRELRNGKTEAPSVYIAGYPGSFYGRIFPENSLHFVYSSYSLHWLSKVPPGIYDENGTSINKGCIYISTQSPPKVPQAYSSQFHQDFSLFLSLRSQELISGGRMVMVLLGRESSTHTDRGNAFLWEILSRSFSILIEKGVVKKEKLDSYDIHFYAPSPMEIEDCIEKQGSLKLERVETYYTEKDGNDGTSHGTNLAMAVRAVQESMISHHFGEEIVDELFQTYGRLVEEELAKEDINPVKLIVVLRKL